MVINLRVHKKRQPHLKPATKILALQSLAVTQHKKPEPILQPIPPIPHPLPQLLPLLPQPKLLQKSPLTKLDEINQIEKINLLWDDWGG